MHMSSTTKILLLVMTMSLFSCSGKRPTNLGIINARLAPCPDTPNCVSSDSTDDEHKIPAFELQTPTNDDWLSVREFIYSLPRTLIITETANYLHAECTSAIMGYVDDLELHLRDEENIIAVRSASRLGSSDFGVNRRRIESIRSNLINRKIID